MTTRTLLLISAASAIALAAPAPSVSQAPINPPAAPRTGGAGSFSEIVDRVAPAVVSIETRRRMQARAPSAPGFPGFPGFPFDFFFGNKRGAPPPMVEGRAEGSGFFISPDGYIVTNNHVIADATEITVTLKDRRTLEARVVGRDPATDLAVLKVEGGDFPYVAFANAAAPRVGDWVIAVGNPFGLGGTATAGIVSAYGRDIGSTFVDYIQIDASINRGNSGGPAFNASGQVIGVNTAIFSPSGGNVGIGFAIPAEVADRVTRALIEDGRVERGYIGASVQTLDPVMAESLGLGDRRGAIVASVTPGGPAERAGLRVGDVLLEVDGRPAEDAAHLTRAVSATRPGEQLRLGILRRGDRRTIDVRAGLRPSENELAGMPREDAPDDNAEKK